MFRGTASRIAVASAVALVAGAAFAVPARADDGPIGPKQYFYGEVFALSASSAVNGIEVACAGPATTGHPVAGQYVAAHQIYPPAAVTAGYTGNDGVEINVNLVYSQGTITVVTPVFATLRYYDQKVEIPTSLTVPCSGAGVLDFTPSPDPDNSGEASSVGVTFESPGV
jgi:hypothetical protein